MSFAQDNGYIPSTVTDLMALVREGINTQFSTTYDQETFLGTNFYKYFYALIQRLQEAEVKTAEIVVKIQQYFDATNESITRPNTTHPGIFDYFTAAGFLVSSKPPIEADAGKLYLAVDLTDNHARGVITISDFANLVDGTDDTVTVGATAFTAQSGSVTPGGATFQAATSNSATAISLAAQINEHATAGALVFADVIGETVRVRALTGGTGGNAIALAYAQLGSGTGASVSAATLLGGRALEDDEEDYDTVKVEIATLLKESVVAGVVTQGDEVETIGLSNNQSFDYRFNLADRIPIDLKLTITTSSNSQFTSLTPTQLRQKLFDNINERYRLGLNFEPQRYFSILDAPWASEVLVEYDDGGGFTDAVYESEYDELFTFALGDIDIVEV